MESVNNQKQSYCPPPKPKAALPDRLSVEAASGSPKLCQLISLRPTRATHQIEQRPAQGTKSVVTNPMAFR